MLHIIKAEYNCILCNMQIRDAIFMAYTFYSLMLVLFYVWADSDLQGYIIRHYYQLKTLEGQSFCSLESPVSGENYDLLVVYI